MPYDQPYTQAPQQPGPPGNMADWTPTPDPSHPNPQADAQLKALLGAGLTPEDIRRFHDQAFAPDPAMPQPPQEKSLSGWEAVAAALHPELLSQFKKNPGDNAQFQGQMAAFQQAMLNKRSAQERLTQIGDTQARLGTQSDIAGLRDETSRRGQDLLNAFHEAMAAAATRNAETKANPPAKPGATKLRPFQTPTGPVWIDPENPDAPAIPVKGTDNSAIPAKGDPNIQSNLNSLDVAERTINDMRQKYDSVASRHDFSARKTMAVMLNHGLTREYVGKMDPDARQHESDRQALTLELNKPETGQNRLLQSVIEQILAQVPSIAEDPAAAHPMYDKLLKTIQSTRNTILAMPQARPTGGGSPAAAASTGSPVLDKASAIAAWIKGGKKGPRP